MYSMIALAAYCMLGARDLVLRKHKELLSTRSLRSCGESLRVTRTVTDTNRCCITAVAVAGEGNSHAAKMIPDFTRELQKSFPDEMMSPLGAEGGQVHWERGGEGRALRAEGTSSKDS